jgi:hypothetical protein
MISLSTSKEKTKDVVLIANIITLIVILSIILSISFNIGRRLKKIEAASEEIKYLSSQ